MVWDTADTLEPHLIWTGDPAVPPPTHCQVEEGLISLAVRMTSGLFGVSWAIVGGGMAELSSAAVLSPGGVDVILIIILHGIMLSVVREL